MQTNLITEKYELTNATDSFGYLLNESFSPICGCYYMGGLSFPKSVSIELIKVLIAGIIY